MTGQTKKSKSQIVEEYIKKVNPYEKPQPIAFNLRGYAAYIKANGLKGTDITPEIMNKFEVVTILNETYILFVS
jgi:hypothetical protein